MYADDTSEGTSMQNMSPAKFALGVTATLAGAFVLYSSLFYVVFEPPTGRLVVVLAVLAIAELIAGIAGYRRWLRQTAHLRAAVEPAAKSQVALIFLYCAAVGGPTAGAIYLLSRGFHTGGLALGLCAAVIALVGLARLGRHDEL